MEPAISFRDVHKEYPFYQHIISAGFKSFLFNLPKNIASLKKTKFMALNGVSFDVRKGEAFGIIGRNGSGKSTILGIMAGVLRQDGGTVKTRGKISSLLELGAGFHPDLSGVENIILNGILMGNTREAVLAKMDRIVEFSELGDFVYQPLRTYSSGMQVRLGFSVAVHIDPEILLVDEALAVGDLNFQEKCQRKMKEFRESGATIVIVSHDMGAIAKLCERALWIDGGRVMAVGAAKEVAMEYLSAVRGQRIFSGQDVAGDTASGESGMPLPEEAPAQAAGKEEVQEDRTEVPEEGAEEQTSSPDEARPLPPQEFLSWWDSNPIVIDRVSQITGSPEDSFYEFLSKQYMIGPLDKGLSICCRLGGIETGFVLSNICKTFDVVKDEKALERIVSGGGEWKAGPYDFFLCIDFLHRLENPGAVLGTIASRMKDQAVIVAIEYVGPPGYARSPMEMKIADAVFALLGTQARREYAPAGGTPPFGSRRLAEGAKSPGDVLPAIQRHFGIMDIRYFAGPLLDMVVARILERDIAEGVTTSPELTMVGNVMRLEEILIREKVLGHWYAMVVAEKKSPGTSTVHQRTQSVGVATHQQ